MITSYKKTLLRELHSSLNSTNRKLQRLVLSEAENFAGESVIHLSLLASKSATATHYIAEVLQEINNSLTPESVEKKSLVVAISDKKKAQASVDALKVLRERIEALKAVGSESENPFSDVLSVLDEEARNWVHKC